MRLICFPSYLCLTGKIGMNKCVPSTSERFISIVKEKKKRTIVALKKEIVDTVTA